MLFAIVDTKAMITGVFEKFVFIRSRNGHDKSDEEDGK